MPSNGMPSLHINLPKEDLTCQSNGVGIRDGRTAVPWHQMPKPNIC